MVNCRAGVGLLEATAVCEGKEVWFCERAHQLALDKFKPLAFRYKQGMIKSSFMITILCQGLGVTCWVGSSLSECHVPFQVSVGQHRYTSEDLPEAIMAQ